MWEQIRYNRIRTAQLVIGIGLLLVLLGYLLGLLLSLGLKLPASLYTPDEYGSWLANLGTPNQFGIAGVVIALIVWAVASLVTYFNGDNIILGLAKAKKIGANDLKRLSNIVEELKISSGLEIMPSIYVIDDPALNAFAVGRDPKKAAVVVTSGLLQKLNRDELQGVIAHEIAHIKNRDVLLMVMCSVLLGTMIILSHYPSYLSWGETTITKQKSDRKKYSDSKNLRTVSISIFLALVALFIVPFGEPTFDMYFVFGCLSLGLTPVAMIVLIGLPFSVLLIYYAISRRREYLADATATLYTRYPEGLASALEKIASSKDQLQSAKPALASIYIANPFGNPHDTKNNNAGTHPPITERIHILRSMTHISLIDYDRAYREFLGTDRNVLPAYALANADTATIRPARVDDIDYIQRIRETSNALWNLNNYKLISCPCGTRMRLPPRYKLPEIKCPHCGRINQV